VLRFDPFSDIDSIAKSLLGADLGASRVPRFMPMDLYRVGDHYVLNADLPGVDPGTVDVSVDHGLLTLSATRTASSDENMQWLASERFAGTYRRQLSLGENIDADKISATYNNGVLSVTIPISEQAKPRRIEVSRAGDSEQTMINPTREHESNR
jgi:HSP20 family protein